MKTYPDEPVSLVLNQSPSLQNEVSLGLTKREHFAAMAMMGYISAGSTGMPDSKTMAMLAIETADALIFALNIRK